MLMGKCAALPRLCQMSTIAALQSTCPYAAVSKVANSISNRLLVDPRNRELFWISLFCAAGTTSLTANLILQLLTHPNSFPWAAFVMRQAFMAGTLAQAFSAKHRESHNRTATYKSSVVQALLGRINEWWTGVWFGNIPETDGPQLQRPAANHQRAACAYNTHDT